jgi:galactokinase
MTPLEERVASGFAERARREPEGLWWAPGRVNLIGEHTDYNDGYVFPFAIDRGTVAAAARRDDGRLRLWSLDADAVGDVGVRELAPGRVEGWTAYPQGIAWALREAEVAVPGADVLVATSLPQGSGLSSSAALALLAQRAETEVAGVPTGAMDQLASMLGRDGHAIFLDTRTLETEPVRLAVRDAGLVLLVVDTCVPRRLADGAYAERRAQCEEAARILGVDALRDATPEGVVSAEAELGDVLTRRARHVVTEDVRVLEAVDALREREWTRLGALLAASHASLRDDYEVSARALDVAVDACTDAGALGARMTGAGFGGCALALVPAPTTDAVAAAVADAFARERLGTPEVFEVAPAAGARRLR